MADTVRTLAAILTLLADNTTGAISEQDLRDAMVSLWQGHLATTHDMASDANYTLNDTQNASGMVVITDTAPAQLTTGRDIIVSAIVRPFFFKNSTLQTLTVKVTGQTGVTVVPGETCLLYCNGTDVEHLRASVSPKVKFTPEGGLAVRLVNKTGGASVAGSVVEADASTDEAFNLAETDDYSVAGIVYEGGVADGSPCWVVSGAGTIAEVLVEDSTAVSRGNLMLCSATQAGRAVASSVIPPPTDAEHFREIGHALTGCTAGTNNKVKVWLHWN